MPEAERDRLALELERLRGTVETGFATISGRLDRAFDRSDQTDKRIDEVSEDVDKLEKMVDEVRRRFWIAIGAAMVMGGTAGSVGTALIGS